LTSIVAASNKQTDFDAIADIYDDVFPSHVSKHYLQQRRDFIAAHAVGRRALDVGAGTGVLAERLSDDGFEVVALDPFSQMLEQLRRRRPEIATIAAPGYAIPLPDDAFDLTYCVAVMHHIAEPELVRQTLAEMVRVTRPAGHVLVWDHNPLNPYWPIIMKRVPQDSGAERLVPLGELIAGLRDAGATIVRADRRGLMPEFVPGSLMPLARTVERVVESLPVVRRFCSHNVVLATKSRW
jgi:ubiquinone/menaquinone biosynthesis C-methylase UbiE